MPVCDFSPQKKRIAQFFICKILSNNVKNVLSAQEGCDCLGVYTLISNPFISYGQIIICILNK